MRYLLFILLGIVPVLTCLSQNIGKKLFVAPGTEDVALDSFTGTPRLIVSCAARRTTETYSAGFWALDPESGIADSLERLGEPSDWKPHFHGIDIVKGLDGKTRLYAISHGVNETDRRNRILIYELGRNVVTLIDSIVNPEILKSPNDVCALPDGTIFWTNDYGSGLGMAWRFIWKCKTSSIGKYETGLFSIVAKRLQYANGILPKGNKLYVSTTRGNKLYEYEINPDKTLWNRKILAKHLKGLDNISFAGDHIIVTSHPKFGKFIGNMKDENNISPSRVYSVSLTTGETKIIFEDDGSSVSACSVARVWEGKLWMGQVFNEWVYSTEIPVKP